MFLVSHVRKTLFMAVLFSANLAGSANAQLLGPQLGVPVVEDLSRQVETDLERPLQAKLPGSALNTLEATAQETVDIAAGSFSVPTLSGATAFVEVEVENGWRAVEREWLLLLSPRQVTDIEGLGIEILSREGFGSTAQSLLRIRVPADRDSYDALIAVIPAAESQMLDRNHIYSPQGFEKLQIEQRDGDGPIYQGLGKIGMIDTKVDTAHPAFSGRSLIEQDFITEDVKRPDNHGTAVASRFVGKGPNLAALTPNVTLYSASVFYERDQYSQGATTLSLIRALDWLISENVTVINMSLAGPPNTVLEAFIANARQQSITIVAAVGNEGPSAPPLFPAAYEGVIAVTAVDSDHNVYRWANQGNHVDFSASGVSVLTARSGGEYGRETGTSLAAPVVAASVLQERLGKGASVSEAYGSLLSQAIDLGKTGRDETFGHGLIGSK